MFEDVLDRVGRLIRDRSPLRDEMAVRRGGATEETFKVLPMCIEEEWFNHSDGYRPFVLC